MVSYKEIREKIQNFPKYKGCKYEDRSPLVNEGFSWTFNLSFGEPYLLKEVLESLSIDLVKLKSF